LEKHEFEDVRNSGKRCVKTWHVCVFGCGSLHCAAVGYVDGWNLLLFIASAVHIKHILILRCCCKFHSTLGSCSSSSAFHVYIRCVPALTAVRIAFCRFLSWLC